ncbi:hypothetical protein [Clostridium estertheticum]|uniref:hypothetical protein n=1 Tax=Clostridium estertheticum TaxID=238834 RepID=UPI00209B6151|nr:hypothetical protein [Clostridium estertheticum]
MDEALGATIDSIKNASTEIFDVKGDNEMTKAIRECRISIDDLPKVMSLYALV